jgi:predicted ABC-type ATPase
VIVAGPNGAGKSTMAPRVVANEFGIRLYVNLDVIAQGLAGFDPASAGIRAGRIMHERLEELRGERVSFAVVFASAVITSPRRMYGDASTAASSTSNGCTGESRANGAYTMR